MLVAAPDHGVQAGALLGALWAGQASHLLLAWGGRCDILVSQGPAFTLGRSLGLPPPPQSSSSSLTLPWPPARPPSLLRAIGQHQQEERVLGKFPDENRSEVTSCLRTNVVPDRGGGHSYHFLSA